MLSLRGHIVLYVLAAAMLPLAVALFMAAGSWSPIESIEQQEVELSRVLGKLLSHELNAMTRPFSVGIQLFELPKLPDEEKVGVLRMLYKLDEDIDLVALVDQQNRAVVPPVFLEREQIAEGYDTANHLSVSEATLAQYGKFLPIEAALEKGRAFSDVYTDQRHHVALIAGAVAVPTEPGAPPWILGFECNLRKVQQIISTTVLVPDHTVFVVDGGGRLVAHPEGKRFLAREMMSAHPVVAYYLDGHRAGILHWQSDAGQPMIGAFQQIDFLDWVVVVERKLSAAQATAGKIPGWAWACWFLVAAMIAATGLLLEAKVRRVQKDMQALKEAEENKNEQMKRVQASLLESRKLNAIGDLGAGVAHEFNNPLGGILGLTQLLLRKKKESDPDIQFLKRIETEAKRCKDITENLLRFSEQLESVHREPLRLDRVMDLTMDLLNRKFESQGIHIERHYAASLPRILGNEGQLRRAFLNVFLNAETAMPQGGKLVLSTAVEGDQVVARVADTGKGIAAENLERVFEPFFTTKDNWKGAGLGLFVVYQAVKDHQGQVTIESAEGKGTVLNFRFPQHEKGKSDKGQA